MKDDSKSEITQYFCSLLLALSCQPMDKSPCIRYTLERSCSQEQQKPKTVYLNKERKVRKIRFVRHRELVVNFAYYLSIERKKYKFYQNDYCDVLTFCHQKIIKLSFKN